jgi:uncharacterized repeat protein (TIGR03803 family)
MKRLTVRNVVAAFLMFCAATVIASPAQTLYSFCSQQHCSDGSEPFGGLVQGTDRSFYGTTYQGGSDNCPQGCGTIFKFTPGQTAPISLWSFCAGRGCLDGFWPHAALVQGTDGNFYGTTGYGGANGGGTIFRITPAGALTTLYSFVDSFYPLGALVQGKSDGYFYGTASDGGAGHGTVFKISADGLTFLTLHSFNLADGATPAAGLVQGTDGYFYGTTEFGGPNGGGTVFKVSSDGSSFINLYNFCISSGCPDGN